MSTELPRRQRATGTRAKICIVASEYNEQYTQALVENCSEELKTVRRNWMRNFKLNANYNYGSSDIYNQNYQDSNIPIWTTTTTGREQSWFNVGASFSIPLDEIFNRRN